MTADTPTNPRGEPTTASAIDLTALAARAYVWGFALVLSARVRQNLTKPLDPFAERPPSVPGAPLNNLGHQRRLADPALRVGVGPNVDTLYSIAWLDLADDTFVLQTPDFKDRYYTFQIAFEDTSCEASYGQRTHGPHLPPLFFAGPNFDGPTPAGMLAIASPTRYLMIGGRVLVQPDDPADFETVDRLQQAMRLRTWERYRADVDGLNPPPEQRLLLDPASQIPEELQFLEELGNVLRTWIVSPDDETFVQSLATIGVGPEHGFDITALTPHTRVQVAKGLAAGADAVLRKSHQLGENINGWTINRRGPRFDGDDLLRSGVAKDQIFVVPAEEALYPVAATDSQGEQLVGSRRYRVRFDPKGKPPVDAFWSLTMYHQTGGLVENTIGRYAIGDRTKGLVTDPDGALTILIQQEQPIDPSVNWLPAPAGEFHVELRLYMPRSDALQGSWTPPAIERLE